jgi:hypothetical protein
LDIPLALAYRQTLQLYAVCYSGISINASSPGRLIASAGGF